MSVENSENELGDGEEEEGPLEGQWPVYHGLRSMKPRASRITKLRPLTTCRVSMCWKGDTIKVGTWDLIHWFSSSVVSHSFHLWVVSQLVSINPDLAAKGRDSAIEKVCQPGGHSGKAFNGKGIRVGYLEFLDLLWFRHPWLSPSLRGRQVSWIACYF